MAGLRVGYGIAAPENIDAFNRIRLYFGVGRLSRIAPPDRFVRVAVGTQNERKGFAAASDDAVAAL